MTLTNRSRIVQLAATIQEHTAKVDAHLASQGLPPLSFDVDFPLLPPELEGSRIAVLQATDELTDLMHGPQKIAECDPALHIAVVGIQAIRRYGIASKVGTNEEVTFPELAERCNLPVEDLRRILRLAMAKHIFKEPRKGYIAHNAASRFFVGSEGLNDWIHVALDEIWPSAAHLLDAMEKWKGSEEANETGFNLAKSTGDSFFESMEDNPQRRDAFANVMEYAQSRPGIGFSPSHLLSSYDWGSVGTVVDIGGGTGATSIVLAQNHPSIRCIVQDLPTIVSQGRKHLPSDLAQQVSFMEHDFFREQTVKDADVYFLRWVLHDWSDKKAISILRNLIPALKPGANLVLQEFVIPEPGVLSFYHEKVIRCIDISMKATFNSKEREMGDWIQLFVRADPRFKFIDAKVPPGSSLAVIHFRWEDSSSDVATSVEDGGH